MGSVIYTNVWDTKQPVKEPTMTLTFDDVLLMFLSSRYYVDLSELKPNNDMVELELVNTVDGKTVGLLFRVFNKKERGRDV